MTGIEPENSGRDQLDEQGEQARREQHGTMRDVQDDAAQQVSTERARKADAGDPQARAEQADKPDRLRHAAEWLDDKLVPKLGPGDIGPYDEEPEESVRSHDVCPLCGHSMGEHTIDRSHPNAVLNCPVPPIPQRQSFEPLNEVGMIKRKRAE